MNRTLRDITIIALLVIIAAAALASAVVDIQNRQDTNPRLGTP